MRKILEMTACSLALVAAASATAQQPAQTIAASAAPLPAGAREGDRNMSCADVATERAAIEAAVIKTASAKEKSAKTKKKLFGFAKTFASVAVPGMMGGLGGTSMLGSLAAQSASATAGTALAAGQIPAASGPAAPAAPSADQQARLDRLARIGAYRQCAG